MENQDNLTPETLAGEADVTSTDGTEAVSDVAEKAVSDAISSSEQKAPDAMNLEELNRFLGKDFKSKDAALKSIKETFNYVGKVGQKQPVANSSEVEDMKRELFFVKNPTLEKHRELLEAVAVKNNVPLQEAAQLDSFKSYVDKADGYEQTQAAKSVLQSNPKLGAVRDSMQEARDLVKQASQSGDPFEAARIGSEANERAVSSVLNAYDLK